MRQLEVKALGHVVRKNEATGAPVFRISSGVLDRHQDRVKPDAPRTENYDKNPVLLWNHDDSQPAIGTARLFREGDEWFMEPHFDRICQLSKDVAEKVTAGTLRTCSWKFLVLQARPNDEGGEDYEEVEVLEASITNVPGNQEAHRVKNNEEKKSEAMDREAVHAMVEEMVKPLQEEIAALKARLETAEKALGGASETEEKSEDGQEEEGTELEVELSPEEEAQVKSFLGKAK